MTKSPSVTAHTTSSPERRAIHGSSRLRIRHECHAVAENGGEQTILRNDIASIQMSDISLMPENFADLLQPQDVADLLGYVREALAAGPQAAENPTPPPKE